MTAEDKRRSRRHMAHLEVDLDYPGWSRRVIATDVSRHGLFVETADPPPEKQLVQIKIHLERSAIHATAYVTRAEQGEKRSGVGLSLFALSLAAKSHWTTYIFALSGGDARERPASRQKDIPSFLLRIPTLEKLSDFRLRVLPTGVVYLQTPVLRPPKTFVAVILIHPETEAEFTLFGTVQRIHARNPRGMEIRLEPITDTEYAGFVSFAELGVGEASASDALTFDIDEAPILETSGRVVFDEPPVSEQFEWRNVSGTHVVDVGLGAANETTIDASPIDQSTEDPTELPAPSGSASFDALVSCKECGFEAHVRLGDADGRMGDLGRWVAYWSPKEQMLFSVLRLKPRAQRQAALERIEARERDERVPLSFAFQVADLTMAPRSPSGQRLTLTEAADSIGDAAGAVLDHGTATLATLCDRCRKGPWTVARA
ncbi:MAG: PilZ domain-containing protein [Deltaproteobacteria bacterium]|nr:PilZ domain-containing protein [Deltaproteobacteria bacterium]